MSKIVKWKYNFLVDDHEIDSDYTEGTKLYSNLLVHAPYKKINSNLSKIFDKILSPIKYEHEDCIIEVIGSEDRETIGSPLCFCLIVVEGVEKNVIKIDKILNLEIPGINESLNK